VFFAEIQYPRGFLDFEVLKQLLQGQVQGEFPLNLMKREVESRQENNRKARIKSARFPVIKTLDTLDFKNLPNVDRALIWQLADRSLITRKEGVCCIGPPGTGKTHTAIGLGLQACQRGHNVRFYTAAALVNELLGGQGSAPLLQIGETVVISSSAHTG
jgi:DNA replication protein DnaC